MNPFKYYVWMWKTILIFLNFIFKTVNLRLARLQWRDAETLVSVEAQER